MHSTEVGRGEGVMLARLTAIRSYGAAAYSSTRAG